MDLGAVSPSANPEQSLAGLGGPGLPLPGPAQAQCLGLIQLLCCHLRTHVQKEASLRASGCNLTADCDVIINTVSANDLMLFRDGREHTNSVHAALSGTCDRIKHVVFFFS